MTATAPEIEGGPTNSHLTAKTGRPPIAIEAGIDTWRLCRYLDSDRDLDHAAALCTGRGFRAPEKVAGHVVGVIPEHRMLYLEGHPKSIGLADPRDLAAAESVILGTLAEHGYPLGRDAGVGRLDQTVTLAYLDPREGLAFLSGLAVVDAPRVKPVRYGRPGQAETVAWMGTRSKRVFARAYDKGVESGTGPPGRLIRLENQTRYRKDERMSVETFSRVPTIARAKFQKRFAPLAASAEGVHAATLPVLAEKLTELVHDDAMTVRQAERLAGFLLLGDTTRIPARTRRRRRRELRDHGLVLTDAFTDPIDVDLGEGLEAALAAWSDEA